MTKNKNLKTTLAIALMGTALSACNSNHLKGNLPYNIEGNTINFDGQIFSVLSPNLISVRANTNATSDYQYKNTSDLSDIDVQLSDNVLVIDTGETTLRYVAGSASLFERLSLTVKKGENELTSPLSQPDLKNLGGIVLSVDRADGRIQHEQYDATSKAHPLPKNHGLLSELGWTVLKDVGDKLVHKDANDSTGEEYFIFSYGSDYRQALSDFVNLNDRVPMLPKWSFGTWYSRYQPLSAQDYKDVVTRFRAEKMPIDVVVPDMNWHKDGWYGIRYDLEKFPDMKEFFNWTEEQGIRVGFNHHPGAVHKDDERSYEFIKELGWSVKEAEQKTLDAYRERGDKKLLETFVYGEDNPSYVKTFFDIFLAPIMDDGLDFNWVDGSPSLANLKAYHDLAENQTNERSIVLTRQRVGSFDHHKYPIGFSADTYISWESLKYNTEMTVTGTNVGVYWSHDIGGHMIRFDDMEHTELFARWVQSGALSPITRLHATGGVEWDSRKAHVRKPWEWGEEVLSVTRDMLQLKYRLLPYIYSLNRVGHDTGLLMAYGMYVDYPEYTNAYKYGHSQYMFGPSMLVAPITEPAANGKGIKGEGFKNLWVPEGTWYDYFSGEAIEGPVETLVAKPIDEMPLFVKAGAILPMASYMEHTGEHATDHLIIEFYQPKEALTNSFDLYEDDGASLEYRNDEFRWTKIEYQFDPAKGSALIVNPAQGQYDDGPKSRSYKMLVKHMSKKPGSVTVNGKALSSQYWEYGAKQLTITLDKQSVTKKLSVNIL